MTLKTTDLQQTEQQTINNSLIDARKKAMQEFETEKPKKGFEWLNENSRKFLAAGYLTEGVSPEERIMEIGQRAEEILQMPGYAQKFYNYMSEGFFSLASPVWSNFGKKRGLPISCFGSHVDDDMGNILYTQSEVGMMSKLCGGTS